MLRVHVYALEKNFMYSTYLNKSIKLFLDFFLYFPCAIKKPPTVDQVMIENII